MGKTCRPFGQDGRAASRSNALAVQSARGHREVGRDRTVNGTAP
jgi:hypothetical protein